MYIAHSAYKDEKRNKDIPRQPYEAHVQGVFDICKRHLFRLKNFCEQDLFSAIERIVLLAAEYHDMGKLDDQAQEILSNNKEEKLINHIDAGVAYLLSLYKTTKKLEYLAAAYLIHAHHIGFCNFDEIINRKRKCLRITYSAGRKIRDHKSCMKYKMKDIEVCKHVDEKMPIYIKRHQNSIKIIHPPSVSDKLIKTVLSNYIVMKVALSILCDSDHEDTSKHYEEPYPRREIPLDAEKRLKVLVERVSNFDAKTDREQMRKEFFKICNRPAETSVSLIDGTVGSGKTLGMIAHALQTANTCNLDTLFIVHPYIALIDQSASEYEKYISLNSYDKKWGINVVHSIIDPPNIFYRKYIRGFNAPVNLTTSVNIFETIASNRTGLIRNIHKVAGSVICIDEYQEIADVKYWPVLIKILNEFIEFFRCKVVLSSGTSPCYWDITDIIKRDDIGVFAEATSIIPPDYHKKMIKMEMKRVKIVNMEKSINFEELYQLVKKHYKSLFIIFNTRPKAFQFTRYIEKKVRRKVYLRYSAIAASDRDVQYEKIKADMKKGKSIIVIGTQGSDVGLDLDFHNGLKEKSNYNSMLQMKGRINRNCKFKSTKMVVFELVDCPLEHGKRLYNNPSIVPKIRAMEEEFEHYADYSPLSCTAITSLEIEKISKNDKLAMEKMSSCIDSLEFETLANDFKLIKMPTMKILVSKDIFEKMMRGDYVSYADLQGNIVNIIMSSANKESIENLVLPISKNKEDKKDKKYYIMDDLNENDYDDYDDDYYDLYYWMGEYDPEKYGVLKGIESGKIVNKPILVL